MSENIFKEDKGKFMIFSTHFYPILKKDVKRCAERIVGKDKLFSTELVFIPVCEGAHWVVYVLCYLNKFRDMYLEKKAQEELEQNKMVDDLTEEETEETEETEEEPDPVPKPILMYCDSLGNGPNPAIVRKVREFVERRYKLEYGEDVIMNNQALPLKPATLPNQNNYCDCGVYILQYAEEIIQLLLKHPDGLQPVEEPTEEEEQTSGDFDRVEPKKPKKRTIFPIQNPQLFTEETIHQKRKTIRSTVLDFSKLEPPPATPEKKTPTQEDDDELQIISPTTSKAESATKAAEKQMQQAVDVDADESPTAVPIHRKKSNRVTDDSDNE
jgi:Ulp1 family protease